jgi:hypothetical protein
LDKVLKKPVVYKISKVTPEEMKLLGECRKEDNNILELDEKRCVKYEIFTV